MDTLGQELKRRREERNIALRDVAEATRLGVRFLHAIEVDDYSSLPGGIYARSFIRAYAKYVGMDEEEAVARYRKQAQDNEPAEPQITFQDFSSEPSSRSLYVWMVGLLALIVVGSWATLHYIDRKNPSAAVNSPAPANVTAVAAANVATPTPSAANAPAPATTPAAKPANNDTNAVVQPAVENIDGLNLTIKTSGQSWVSVRADEQQNSQMVTIQSGETRDFKASSKMKVTIGNLPAVEILINGQPAKLPSANGLVVSNVAITKENYKEFIAAAEKEGKTAQKPAATPAKPATSATNTQPKPPIINPTTNPAAKPPASTANNNQPAVNKPATSTSAPAVKPSPKPEGASAQKTDKPAASVTATKPAEKPKPVVKTEDKPE